MSETQVLQMYIPRNESLFRRVSRYIARLVIVICIFMMISFVISWDSLDSVPENKNIELNIEPNEEIPSKPDFLPETKLKFNPDTTTAKTQSKIEYPFNDPGLSWETRVNDLVGRLTLGEITAQMARGGRTTYAPGLPHLGIKPYPWGSECLRGDVQAGPATSFPQAIGLAATFSRKVISDVAKATGLEVRAKFNNYSAHEYYGMHSSASCWSPVINIARDPRWGRNQETYGEDPFLTGEFSASYVQGLQGNHPRYIMANAGCKHYAVYSGPENIPISRHEFDAVVSETDLRNTFLPAFKKCVQAGTYSIMCSYNRVNGIPACASKYLLQDILRSEWGFNGYVISDEGAIEDIMDNHRYVQSKEDAAAVSVLAGTNLEDGPGRRAPYFDAITDAVRQGKLDESVVREAVKPLFHTRMRLGLFDPPEMNPFSQLNVTTLVQSKAHVDLAISSALRSYVLLKNDGVLPIRMPDTGQPFKKIAIVGPMADNVYGIFGGYAPEPDARYVYTPVRGLHVLGDTFSHDPGCIGSDTRCQDYNAVNIQKAVTGSDFVVVCLGTGSRIESESRDRTGIKLPGEQLTLLQDVVKYSRGQVVLVLFDAGPLDVSWAVASDRVNAIIECFFPAQGTGQALFKLFTNADGKSSPAGRLPVTWPAYIEQYPVITNYTMVNRTYRYFTDTPLFPFGYGLSYTTFKYTSVEVRPNILRFTDIIMADVVVENTGSLDSEEVVQLYINWPNRAMPSTPKIQMIGFERYMIKAGQSMTCSFKIQPEELVLWDDREKKFVVPEGVYTLYAGGQQPNQKVQSSSNVINTTFTVHI